MSKETSLFTPVLDCDDLTCINCKITSLEVMNDIAPSIFHCQVFTCRSILTSLSGVIAAPAPRTEDSIQIIAKKYYFQSSEVQELLKSKKLLISDPQPVTSEVYRMCIEYTMMFRLAPSWNKFGQYLCQGENFLTSFEDPSAVKFNVDIKKQGMFLKFSSMKLKVCPMKVERLGLPPSILSEFKQNPEGVLFLGKHWANVLPSMMKARLLKVSKLIPKTCPFKNYQLLRRHWKDMYGYILPEKSEGISYYEVCFSAFPEHTFVYPDICLQSEPPKMIPCKNQALICIQFVESLNNKVRTVCGKSLSLTKSNSEEFKDILNPRFFPAQGIGSGRWNSQVHSMPSIYGSSNQKSNIVNGSKTPNLKQQTLNFPKLENASMNLSTKSLENSNSSQNENTASKLKSPEFSAQIFSQFTQSAPIQRKLIINPKDDNDNISVKSETFKSLLNLIKSNETSVKKENKQKRTLVDALLQEKSDVTLSKIPFPSKRVRIFKKDPQPPLESVTKYFKVQKSTFDKSLKTQNNRLQFQNLKKNT